MTWNGWSQVRRATGVVVLALFLAPAAGAGIFDDYDDDFGYESHRTYFIKLEAGAALMKPSGDLRLGDSNDTKLDLDDELNLGDDKTYWARLDFQPFLRHHIRFTYSPLRFAGDRDLDPGEGISVNGQGFSLGEIDTDFRLVSYDIAYRWDAMYIGEQVTLSPIVAVSLLDGKARIKHKTAGVTDVNESESFFVPIPAVGLRLEGYPMQRLGFYGEAKGMTIGKKATTWDVEAGMEFHIINNVSVNARYRLASYSADVSDFDLKAKISGPFVGLGFRF